MVPLLDFGGVEQRIKSTAHGMGYVNCLELYTIVLGNGGRISDQLIAEGYQIRILGKRIKIINPILIFILFRIFIREKPDVVHTSGAEANFHGLIAAWLANVPIRVGEEIGFPNHGWKWKWIFKCVYTIATDVIAISEAVKKRIIELGEVGSEKVKVVYNPVFLSLDKSLQSAIPKRGYKNGNSINFENLNLYKSGDRKPFIFITTCRLVPVKNLHMLFKVFADLLLEEIHEDLQLWIVGDGPERIPLEKLAIELNIFNHVEFWGFQRQISSVLLKSDVFVLPSISEGFSISLVEAMLAGLPCIVTDQGGPGEIIENGTTGFLVNPHDSFSWKANMSALLNMSETKRLKIGEVAKVRGQTFSIENYINRLLEVYQQHE